MIIILGYKKTGKRAVPEIIYAGLSGADARDTIETRIDEDWSRVEKLRNPSGQKVPFRTIRAQLIRESAYTSPTKPGLFLPESPTPSAAPYPTPEDPTAAIDLDEEETPPEPKAKPTTKRKRKH